MLTSKLKFDPEAEKELAETLDWYSEIGNDLHKKIYKAFSATLEIIKKSPQSYVH